VQTSVNPKVIDCPAQSSPRPRSTPSPRTASSLKAKARVTVRTNIARLVGGATEETIIARVGQGIVSTIGSAATTSRCSRTPTRSQSTVMESGLDAGTAFEILSIDIADIDVGDNIGAKLQPTRPTPTSSGPGRGREAAAPRRRRGAGVPALEQKNRAVVVLAEAESIESTVADPSRCRSLL
jgi:uncharacterized protein YqfA (UPF0365 family)